MSTSRWSIGVASELAVVRYDPEYADMDHPNGEIIGERFYLVAENSRGDRRAYGWYGSEAQAQADIPLAPPILTSEWSDTDPAYGSAAYQAYGAYSDIAAESRLQEYEDWGFDTRYARVY